MALVSRIEKTKLLEILRENRAQHQAIFEEAARPLNEVFHGEVIAESVCRDYTHPYCFGQWTTPRATSTLDGLKYFGAK